MRIWQKLWRFVTGLVVVVALPSALTLTPVFANIGALVLEIFSKITLTTNHTTPTAIVLLGGGLTKKDGQITLNHYTQSRADTAIVAHAQHELPIITSGAESPWLQDYIKLILPRAVIISDNASMNTCENAVFTAKLLNHHELAGSVYLVTDRYHMARARRQFARMGIHTIGMPAPLVIPLTWGDWRNNWVHSRRTIYEMIALVRDIVRPQDNCRSMEDISLEEISTPRRAPKIFSEHNYS